MQAYVFDPLWTKLITPAQIEQLKQNEIEVVLSTDIAPLTECTAMYTGSAPRILCVNPDYVGFSLKARDYENIPNLQGIFGEATSISWIDRSIADEKGIPICNIRNFSTDAVADWAIMMMLNLCRQTPRLIKADFPLDFDKDFINYLGVGVKGLKVGIVGLGNIGSAIADRCSGLGMHVSYWSRSPKQSPYDRVDLSTLMAESDVVFPTVALCDDTRLMLSDELLQRMKSTSMLVSICHGVYDEQTVVNMVKDGRLFGFGFEAEPGSFNKYEGNIWAAPAYGWATAQSMENSMAKWVENMVNAANGKFPNRC